MAKKAAIPFASLAATLGTTVAEVKLAWEDLVRRGLGTERSGQTKVSALAMRRAGNELQRRLASHLSGFVSTENSFIVCREGTSPGNPSILNTRISVEHIAEHFKEGHGVADIQRDLPQLTREEIEAAVKYYLNHREEIERDLRRSRQIYEKNAPIPESVRS